jgi:glyoxylate carboligase
MGQVFSVSLALVIRWFCFSRILFALSSAGTNMITGLYSAIADSCPVLYITGQAPRAKLHKEDFQAVDIAAI